ncbi:MAG: aspartate aminotransferase family protein [Armatimonadetes bacterium CG2_30_59_28]|nr:acetylornithine transaminase [Armatimonadota bacterium]OIO90929.1 MAG: aspartate aminotransferase family protein [Armatimonadetes bacterium CG2_30_59_28]PIU66927.1 MAG: aspartate aminotransferase family protein [Armatimonadetes bacterium CG07_land_8_20_14_0_80_59_28]PIY38696.1 MAG: aspartate aminotransferase family protein [Armatimonadetes bacterium CG_4_10_14_3_um_filter_59_10]
MELQEIVENTDKYIIHTYGRLPMAFVRGEGTRLWDTEGKEYLDLLGGIAVVGLGHCHPKVVAAIQKQAATLMHTSNLYHIPLQAQLAEKLYEFSGGYRSFYCNSGAEANEAAIKLARKYSKKKHGEHKYEIIVTQNSFHGRTLTTVAATGQPKYQKGFEPLPAGFRFVPFNDLAAARDAVTENTCAVMIEPIQGESGIYPATDSFMVGLRALCDEKGMLLVLDEVQTGIARTGRMFAHEYYGIQPDIFTLAKSIAGGFPMGVMLATEGVASGFQPGDHASTFGGNPLACAAGLAACEVVVEENLVGNAAEMGKYFIGQLSGLRHEFTAIGDVRGKGLMIGVELTEPKAKDVQTACFSNGLILNAIGDTVLRLVPPLTITRGNIDEAICKLRRSMTAAGLA